MVQSHLPPSQCTRVNTRSLPRKHHQKVRTGCDNCKQRRVKCDEAKPYCRRCTKSGRKCQGYHSPKVWLFEVTDKKTDPSFTYDTPPSNPNLKSDGNPGLEVSRCFVPSRGILPFSVDSLRSSYTGCNESRLSTLFEFTFFVYGPNFVWRLHTTEQEHRNFAPKFVHFCMHETALLEALFAVASRHMPTEHPDMLVNDHESLQHYCRSLKLLQKRLTSLSAPFDDEVYWTVVAILVLNQERNDWGAFAVNLAGLRRIIKVRGGIDAIKDRCPRVTTFHSWAESTYAQYEKSLLNSGKPSSPEPKTIIPTKPRIFKVTHEEDPTLPVGIQSMITRQLLCPEVILLSSRMSRWMRSHAVSTLNQYEIKNLDSHRVELAHDLDQILHHHPLQPHEYLLCIGMFVLVLSHPPYFLVEEYPLSLNQYVKTAIDYITLKTTASAWVLWTSLLIASTPVCLNLSPDNRWKLLDRYIVHNRESATWEEVQIKVADFFWPTYLQEQWKDCWLMAALRLRYGT